jgi:hypothetical protein
MCYSDAVGSRYGYEFGVWIITYFRPNIGIKVAGLIHVKCSPDGSNFHEPHSSVSCHESRIDMLPRQTDGLRVVGEEPNVLAKSYDYAVVEKNLPVGDDFGRGGVNGYISD